MFKHLVSRFRSITPLEIFAAITVGAILMFAIKFYTYKGTFRTIRVEVIKKNWQENYDPNGSRVPFWLSSKIQPGLTEKNASGQTIATVLKAENYLRSSKESDVYLNVQVNVSYNPRTERYTFKDRSLDNGSPIEFNFKDTTIVGQIVDNNLPPEGYPSKTVEVKARIRNLSSSVYSKIVPGLKVYDRAENKSIAEITAVKVEAATLPSLRIDNNNVILSPASDHKDAVITAKMLVTRIDNRWIFSGHQDIKVSNKNDFVYFLTDTVNLYDLEIESVNDL